MNENELKNINICTESYAAFISINSSILIETEFHYLSKEIE